MNRAVLYVRLSKEDMNKQRREDDSESIVNQRLLLTDYAIEHGYRIVDVYSDDDYSGLYDDRPGFEQLICDAKLGKFDIILAKSQSRFTRNMEHVEKYLHHDFPLLGIRFIGIVDGVDTAARENKKARQIYGLTNEWYCEDLSANIRCVFKRKMREGQFLGAFAPYGYKKDTKDGHKLLEDNEAANVVRRIFSLYADGISIQKICHILEDEGIPNPSMYKQQQGLPYSNARAKECNTLYCFWSVTTVRRILGNETYIGKLIQGTCERASYKDKKVVSVPKEKWIIVENHHMPIVSEDLFYRVQELKKRRRIAVPSLEGDKKTYALAGKIKCRDCGATMIKSGGVRNQKGDWYLRCRLANKSRNKECTSHSIKYSAVEQAVLTGIRQMVNEVLQNDKEELLSILKQLSGRKKKEQEIEKWYRKEQRDLKRLQKAFWSLYTDRINGTMTEETFCELKKEYEEEYSRQKDNQNKTLAELERIKTAVQSETEEENLPEAYFDFSRLTHEIAEDYVAFIEIGEKEGENREQKVMIHWKL